jgi:acyl-CoA synthetase (AMP-forming)/AMP-acid ligase II
MPTHNLGEVIPRGIEGDRAWIIEVDQQGQDVITRYDQLQLEADQIAAGLRRRGLPHGARVGILAANGSRFYTAFLATMRAGLVSVPINFKLPRDTIDYIIDDAGIELMFVDAERAPMASRVPTVRLDDDQDWLSAQAPGPQVSSVMGQEELALILYTSGSTGRPKGVPLTHGGYIWVIETLDRVSPPFRGKRALVAAPLYHMNALIQSLLIGVAGGTVVLLTHFNARRYIEAAARHRCHMVTAVPTMYALVARETEWLARHDLSHVESAKSGSAPASEGLFDMVARVFPKAASSNWWGTTESGPVAFGAHPDGVPRPTLSLGYPLAGTEWRLVDGPSPDEGVLQVRSPAVSPGYLNLPEVSARRFKDGWYDTGDVMRRDDQGFFYFVGRADDMFVCGGENIYPGEVEKMLETHPGIAQAVVLPVNDEIKGQIPAAFVVLRAGHSLTADEVKQYALKHGPAYQHPRFVEFLPEMPLAGTNKIDRKVLADRAARLSR